MKTAQLNDLKSVSEVLYHREHNAIHVLLIEEGRLRTALMQLDQQASDARKDLQQGDAMQRIGADIVWQRWLTRSRRALNIELATVLAQKSNAMVRVRAAFGRKEAINQIMAAAQLEKARKSRRF